MMKMSVGVFAAAVVAAVSVQASTWTIFHEHHKPVKDGAEIGDIVMTPTEQIDYVLVNAASEDTIVFKPGEYDLSGLTPVACAQAYCYLVAKDSSGTVQQRHYHFRGENTKPWHEKTPEEETVLKADGRASICLGYGGGGRGSSYMHLTFEGGRRVTNKTETGNVDTGTLGGGAICHAQTECIKRDTLRGSASNCVFRSCTSVYTGGATYGVDVYNSLYTNCTAGTQGGGAYGFCGNNTGTTYITNIFVGCVFKDCTAQTGGSVYAAQGDFLKDCTFERCRATNGSGGGFYSGTPVVEISGCSFDDCRAVDGGGVKVNGNLDMLTNCTFVSCGFGSGNGGAVNTRGPNNADVLGCVVDCSFTGCSAGWGGGALFVDKIGDVIRCAFTNNVSKSSGGGIYSGSILGVVEDSIFVANTATTTAKGGGFCANGGTISRLTGCEFVNNTADGEGGGVYMGGAVPEISGCVFRDNTATNNGGGLVVDGAVTALSNSVFCGNVAFKSSGASGGAVCIKQAVGAIEGCAFTNNTAKTAGGAVYLSAGVTRLEACSFFGNEAESDVGGALSAQQLIGGVTNCTFACNRSGWHGGALSTANNIGPLADSTFVSNVAAQAGGAIRATGSVASADRCAFSDNAATTGAGGINMATTSGVFTDCVFHSNTNNETLYGAHAPRALKMVRCRFSGYGDVCARDYDSCIFSNCVYRYTHPDYGSDGHGLITYPYAIGNGSLRNCLVQGCLVSRIIASEGVTVDIENCTFADNEVADVPPAGKSTHAIMFFAFRQNDYTMSTNRFTNCIFADNWQSGKNAIDAYFQMTSRDSGGVTRYSCTLISNCLYRTKAEYSGTHVEKDFIKGDPKFVKDNVKFAGQYPNYMICRDSAAVDAGLALGWHATGKDLLGTPRVYGAAVDIGAYESILPIAYVGDEDYETLEEAIAAAGATTRIGLYGDARLDNWEQVAAERYFLEANGHKVTAPAGADVQVVLDTLSVKVSDIYEPAGDYNVMGGDVAGLIEALKNSSGGKRVVLSPGVFDLSGLPEADYSTVWTASSKDAHGKASVIWSYTLVLKGACKTAWAERDPARETVIRNGGDMRIFYGYSGSGRTSEFYNLSFEGGAAGEGLNGGAIVFASASGGGFAKNCVFRNCSAGVSGGATCALNAYDCLYTNCTAGTQGGGAYGYATNDTSGHKTNFFENCTFVGCSASSGGGLFGQDLRWITGCVFSNNTAQSGNGGAVYVKEIQTVSNSTFACNKSLGTGVGGFYCSNLCGDFLDSTFFDNSNKTSVVGGHLRAARNVRGCTFGGYGDVLAKNLENCTFDGCRTLMDSTGFGLLTHDSATGDGVVRNCLFANCTAVRLCTTTNGKQCEFDNCTFADNKLLQGAGSACGYLFYAFRDPNLPSTNYISNCVFANNDGGVDTPAVKQCDVTCYGTSTSVPSHAPAANLFSNCAYEKGIYRGDGVKTEENCRKGNVKFAKDDPALAGQYPDYMTKRSSAAHGLGAWADWMAGAKDLAGTDMPASAPVDAGCYQCTLRAPGMMLIFK